MVEIKGSTVSLLFFSRVHRCKVKKNIMDTFESRYEALVDEAVELLRTLILTFGTESKHNGYPSISVKDSGGGEDYQYNLEGGRWLDEVINLNGEISLVDNRGYQYSPSVLETEQLMKLTDYLRTPGVA